MSENAHHLDTWIVFGTSPSAVHFSDPVMSLYPSAITIVANGAITLFSAMHVDPDYVWIHDGWTAALFSFHIRSAQRRKTVIVAPERAVVPLAEHRIKVNLATKLSPMGSAAAFVRESDEYCGCSGSIITKFAISNGAKRIALVGMEGYVSSSSRAAVDTFDGRRGPHAGQLLNADRARLLQSMIDACPDVQFEFYGEPRYKLIGDNLTVFPDAEAI